MDSAFSSSARPVTRREVLRRAGGVAVASLLPTVALGADAHSQDKAFRFAFLPDIHYMRERNAPEGMKAALAAVAKLDPSPAFLVTGGDQLDGLRSKTPDDADKLADEFVKIWNAGTKLPVYHVLGNHDVVGWDRKDVPADHPSIGFNLMLKKLDLKSPFYSFDHGGWHFAVLLNMTLTKPGDYVSEFPENQMKFLRTDLEKAKGKPTIVFGHFPPLSAAEFVDGRAKVDEKNWLLSTQRMTRNPKAFFDVANGRNVKAFVSGHIHRTDEIQVMGQRFICAGSVSGDKWRGHDHDTPEGFAIFDCKPDGSFAYRYYDYGWKASSGK